MEEKALTETKDKNPLLLWMKIQTGLLAALLALLLIGGIFAAVQVNHLSRMFRGVDLDKVNAILLSVQNTAAQLEDLDSKTINEAIDALKGAAENLAQADVDAVNEGILSLTEAAKKLQELDIEQLNELVKSLEATVQQMEKTTTAFNRLFGK